VPRRSGDCEQRQDPAGYWTTWGTFEQLQSATRRLQSWCRGLVAGVRCCSSCSTTSRMACWCSPAFHSR
jgi:hypothetical protein